MAWSGVDSRKIRRWRGLFAALLIVLGAAAAAPEQATAQTETTFISNSAQSSTTNSPAIRGTAFTTGTGTYTLSSVGVQTGPASSSTTPSVQIYGDTSGLPGTLVATMTNPGTITENVLNIFTAPANTTLSASTTYWLVTSNSATSDGRGFRARLVGNDNLDSGTATGWTIGGGASKTNNAAAWGTSSFRIRLQIRGTVQTTTPTNAAPTVANVIPDQTATAGSDFSYTFPTNTFNDTDTGDTLIYTATKGDDTSLPTWLGFDADTRTFKGTPAATDVETVVVKVIADDSNGGTISDEFNIGGCKVFCVNGLGTCQTGTLSPNRIIN